MQNASSAKGPLTVSQVTGLVQRAIAGAIPSTIHVAGEISNYKRHSSGHLYFTLKDQHSELSCVMWRSGASKLKFDPHDGLEIIASGTVEVFERAGRYQLYARKLEPKGVGSLELAFRQLCEKLEEEGLFDADDKKPLPAYPSRIAIVTSPTGAAIADMIKSIKTRYPCAGVLVYPVRVQGQTAANEIATAIGAINRNDAELGGVDVLIVGRGGGSLEDLWAFNEEVVARAIYASTIPVISAVGHEVDITIADLVADVRAATPTAAGQIAVPDLREILGIVTALEKQIRRRITSRVELASTRFGTAVSHPLLKRPLDLVRKREQILDELALRAPRDLTARVHRHRKQIEAAEAWLQRIAPHAYLARTGNALRQAAHRIEWGMAARWRRGARRLDRLVATLPATSEHRFDIAKIKLSSVENVLSAVGHKSVLSRGFSITRLKKGRRIVRSVADLVDRQRLITQLADGEVESETINIHQMELFD